MRGGGGEMENEQMGRVRIGRVRRMGEEREGRYTCHVEERTHKTYGWGSTEKIRRARVDFRTYYGKCLSRLKIGLTLHHGWTETRGKDPSGPDHRENPCHQAQGGGDQPVTVGVGTNLAAGHHDESEIVRRD